MLEFGDIITLENNNKYVVASTCIYKEKFYAYLVNEKNSEDCILGVIENDNLEVVENVDTFVEVMPLILDNVNTTIFEDGGKNE